MARWASAPDGTAVLGAGPRGPVRVDLTVEGPHLLVEGPAGSGRTELLRAVAASLAAGSRPDRLGLLLVDGAGGERGDGLGPCTDLPHVTEHLVASDPVRMRAFAQSLGAELKRRAELLGYEDFTDRYTSPEGRPEGRTGERQSEWFGDQPGERPGERQGERQGEWFGERPGERSEPGRSGERTHPGVPGQPGPAGPTRPPGPTGQAGRPRQTGPAVPAGRPPGERALPEQRGAEARTPAAGGPPRPRAAGRAADPAGSEAPAPLPRLVVLVDDYDALVAPALGSPGRPAAGSVVRALEAVARDGERLGVHLVASSASPERTADTELARRARLRVVLDAPPVAPGPDDPAPGRGRLGHPDGRVTPFQAGRVTGRIPRTATLRPTVVPLEWERMGDPPARRPLRELGNGPTDLALLASALDRAARSVEALPVPPLAPTSGTAGTAR
ncbi:FtsK/SpoIIIE domain-containing protein [Streptomyces changanensis]